jgi:hypothetical protein
MLLKLHWHPSEAIIATIVASMGIAVVQLVHPGLHMLAYAAGWLVLAGIVYQTGCELSERKRIMRSRKEPNP